MLAFVWLIFLSSGCSRDDSSQMIALKSWVLHGPHGVHEQLDLPAKFDDRLPDAPTPYRLNTVVAIPAEWPGDRLCLGIPLFWADAELFVDGVLAEPLHAESPLAYRRAAPMIACVDDRDRTVRSVELELRVVHRWAPSAWLQTVPRLSPNPHGDAFTRRLVVFHEVAALAMVGVLFIVSATYFLIYWTRRRIRYAGWLGFQAILAAPYLLLLTGHLQRMVGTLECSVFVATVAGAVFAGAGSTYTQYEQGRLRIHWFFGLFVCVGAAVLFSDPFDAPRVAIPLLIAFLVCGISELLYVNVRAALSASPLRAEARLLSIAWAMLFVGCTSDFVGWLGWGEILGGLRSAPVGMLGYVVFQIAALARNYANNLQRSEELAASLALRVTDLEQNRRTIELLNADLRRQIAARSELLSRALSRLPVLGSKAARPAAGERIDGRYEIVRELGAGASGLVYEVERVDDGGRFALKILTELETPEVAARFAREAQLIAKLDHPNVMRIVDVEVASGGLVYIVTELLEGGALAAFIADESLDLQRRLVLLRDLARGVAAVHQQGIVHRDIKPANVLCTASGGIVTGAKLGDFGISGFVSEPSGSSSENVHAYEHLIDDAQDTVQVGDAGHELGLTRTGSFLGTPRYMAPELRHAGAPGSTASDVFSFGVTAYQVIARRMPFDVAPPAVAPSEFARPAPLRSWVPELDPDLAGMIERCLDADPVRRPSAEDLADALDRALVEHAEVVASRR